MPQKEKVNGSTSTLEREGRQKHEPGKVWLLANFAESREQVYQIQRILLLTYRMWPQLESHYHCVQFRTKTNTYLL